MTKADNRNAIERERQTVRTPPCIATPLPGTAASNLVARAFEQFGDLEPIVAKRTSHENTRRLKLAFPIRPDDPKARERALVRVERLADRGELNSDLENLRAAVYEPATPDQIHMLVGVLLDGIPAAKSQGVGLLDAIACTIEHADDDRDPGEYPPFCGFSTRVLKMAIQMLLRTCTFAPAPSEVLATAIEARWRYWKALRATDKVLDLRLNAEDIINATDPIVVNESRDDNDPPF